MVAFALVTCLRVGKIFAVDEFLCSSLKLFAALYEQYGYQILGILEDVKMSGNYV